MAEAEGIRAERPRVLGDTSRWMLKVSMMISRIGMERGRVLRAKEQER